MTRLHVMVTAALVFVFSAGSAYAALQVRSIDIVNGEVKTVDLADGAVVSKKIASNAVTGATLNENTLAIVPNADQLDGRDSASFLAGPGRFVAGRTSVNRGAIAAIFSSAVGGEIGFNLAYQCPGGSPSVPGKFEVRDRSGAGWDVWYQDGGDDPVYMSVAAGATAQFDANQQTHSIKLWMVSKAGGSQATATYSVTDALTTCRTAAFATLSKF